MIQVFSSFAEDILLNWQRQELKRQLGGPAHFIKQALENAGADFSLVYSAPAQVEMVMTESGETNTKLVSKAPAFTPVFEKLMADAVLISTTINEVNLDGLKKFGGPVFLDVQGYVRNPEDSSKQRLWEIPEGVRDSVLCLKATEGESKYLPAEFLERQKRKILLITKGAGGVEIHALGEVYNLTPRVVVKARDTIGAGDTFLANFAYEYGRNANILESAEAAMEKVREFLEKKPTLAEIGAL